MLKNVVFTLILITQLIFSDSLSTKTVTRTKDAKAIEFRHTGFLNLTSLSGSTISYKKFTADKKAIRIGITMNGYQDWDEGDYYRLQYIVETDTSFYDTSSYDINSPNQRARYSIVFQSLKYFEPYNSVSIFYGYGPTIGYAYDLRDTRLSRRKNVTNTTNTKQLQMTKKVFVGLTLLLGSEWYINKNLSITTEYQTKFIGGNKVDKYESERIYSNGGYYRSHQKKGGLYYEISSRVLVGLSIYFK